MDRCGEWSCYRKSAAAGRGRIDARYLRSFLHSQPGGPGVCTHEPKADRILSKIPTSAILQLLNSCNS
jgi:hypothetical protein